MALSDEQKHDVIFFLGYPGKTLISGSTNYSNIVSDRLDNLNDQIETQVAKLLRKLKKVDEKIEEAMCRFSTEKVDDVKLNENERVLLSNERKRYIRQLSELLDISMYGGCPNGINMVV
jgi:hypothetical protein